MPIALTIGDCLRTVTPTKWYVPSMRPILWCQGHARWAEPWFVLVPNPSSSKWLMMQAAVSCWISCEVNWQTVLFTSLLAGYIHYGDRMRFNVCNMIAALNSIENEVCRFTQKVKKQYWTILNVKCRTGLF